MDPWVSRGSAQPDSTLALENGWLSSFVGNSFGGPCDVGRPSEIPKGRAPGPAGVGRLRFPFPFPSGWGGLKCDFFQRAHRSQVSALEVR